VNGSRAALASVRGMVLLPSAVPIRVPFGGFRAGCRYAAAGVRATARALISQFAEANSTWRWLRFLAIPR
jgi:hypothetical protein